MNTPSCALHSFRRDRTFGHGIPALAFLAVFCAAPMSVAAVSDYKLGFADYQNLAYTSGPVQIPGVSDYAATNTTIYQGHVGPYKPPMSYDVPTTPTDGSTYTLIQSAVGAPVGGQTFFGADYYLGEEIVPPMGEVEIPLNHVPLIDPPQRAFYVPTANKLFAGDRGLVNITYNTVLGTTRTMTYVISNRTVQDPVRIYHTESDKGSLIALTSAPTVTIHYNTAITTSSKMWISPADKMLHAKEDTGMVVLHYDVGTSFAGIEIVDVRPYLPDYRTTTTFVGSLLSPRRTATDSIGYPTVSRGDTGPRPYVYQYVQSKDPSVGGRVFSVRPTSANNQIHLYWKQRGRYPGVEWPYELHAYESRWNPATVWDRMYHTYDGTLAPPVNMANVSVVQFFYNDEITTVPTIFLNANPREIRGAAGSQVGKILVRMDLTGTTGPSFLEFLDIRPYTPDFITNAYVGDTLTPTNSPADRVPAPVVARGTEGAKPYAYQYDTNKTATVAGQVFTVRPTSTTAQVRLFWKHRGYYPGMEWPYELHAYQAGWNPATDWQRIYYTADGSLGPTVNVAGLDILQFFYNEQITSSGSIFVYPNPREIRAVGGAGPGGADETGKILLRMDDLASTGPSVLEFVQVFTYYPDYVTARNTGDLLSPTRVVADPLLGETFVRRGWNANPSDPTNYCYQHNIAGGFKGAVFAIRPTTQNNQIEVFFKRLGKKGLIWPYEMHRYTNDWPPDTQLFVRGSHTAVPGPKVPVPKELNATLMPFQEYIALGGSPRSPVQHAELNSELFFSDIATKSAGDYYALLQYQTGPANSPGSEWVGFEPVKCARNIDVRYFDRSHHPWSIGAEVTDAYHRGPAPGYIYHVTGVDVDDKYDPKVYNEGPAGYPTGQVFSVFPGKLEVWWSNVTTHGLTLDKSYGVQWPSKVMRYACDWPTSPEVMVIASQTGSGMIPAAHRYPEIYYQNDKTKFGYNPNFEHAQLFPLDSGLGAFALRCDLNVASTDKPIPYVILKYRDTTDRNLWRARVFRVLPEDDLRKFWYGATAGRLIQLPYPLAALPNCGETSSAIHNGNYGVSGPFWQDRNYSFWARAARDDGGTSHIVMRYWYPIQEGWVFPDEADNLAYPVGARCPWLSRLPAPTYTPGTPVDVHYTVSWPDIIPTLKTAETLVTRKFGLPDIMGQCSVEVIYESLNHSPMADLGGSHNVQLIDPLRERKVDLDELPTGADSILTESRAGKTYFSELPPHMKSRISWDPIEKKLAMVGEFYDMLGEDLLLVNVLTQRDKQYLYNLTTNTNFRGAVDDLFEATSGPIVMGRQDSNSTGKAVVGVSSGNGGYVTLAMQNHDACRPLPVSLEIIRVVDDLYKGELKVIEPDCVFDEKLTLRHSGDFAGKADQYAFKWQYHPDIDGVQPATSSSMWFSYPTDPTNGTGALDVTIYGPGIFTLSDNWFRVRYRRAGDPDEDRYYSTLTPAQMAPGWIKRVVGRINPFTQRASGGGIQGAENRFSQFQTQTVNTIVNMIAQAGARWVGSVPLNCSGGLDKLGLIEIYETVLGRGKQLSVDAGYRYPPANNALLLAAGRIADLYMLLGNEAYADAADPTVAFGTEDRTYGTEASSIYCFMNQTASLLEEELGLLRGRDDSKAPGVMLHPLYNRLMWNFTRDITGGEVAYALNYNIQDALGNADGTINELDAMKLYPQGHGDAWGHYLTAIKKYYGLLKHRNFDWVPRAEAVLVAGQAVTVDYLDERKFAKVAAAKAHAGAEIVNLTYRQAYVEDPAGQWQGYKDGDPDRAWGLSEWASRAGQGAYFDWVVANSILPASDTLHTGIQKVDRTTVVELREISAAFDDIHTQLDQADIGLNPLGLAKNVIPFDIDPSRVTDPIAANRQTHFEQIYDRALLALQNAVTVFNHATNCTQLLRRQADTQTQFQENVTDREADFNSRLIEVFGYPYSGDIGEGKTYPQGYNGPDMYHYDYVDVSELLGRDREPTQMFQVRLRDYTRVDDEGNPSADITTVTYHVSMNGFGTCVPEGEDWGQRRAPGQIQQTRSRLIQLYGQFEKIRAEYADLVGQVRNLANRIDERIDLKTDTLNTVSDRNTKVAAFNAVQKAMAEVQNGCKNLQEGIRLATEAGIEMIPKSAIVGLAVGGDVTAPARGGAKLVSNGVYVAAGWVGGIAKITGMSMGFAAAAVTTQAEYDLLEDKEDYAVKELVYELRDLVRKEPAKRLELATQVEAMVQAAGEYQAALAKGVRLIEDRTRFRTQTASKVQDYRYKDMAFRIFRNDALQKYRAQYDLAARYIYLAAKAYDYETNLLDLDRQAGEFFMTSIVRARSVGTVLNGLPQTGSGVGDPGLADIMARMKMNWDLSLKGQLGFNNPQTETNRFSLRRELFRTVDDPTWREVLRQHRVDDLLSVPEFKRYCRVFEPHLATEPGIVIPIPTTVNFGFNFFGRELASGDSAYDSTNFATKVRSVGVWFSGYDALTSTGLSNTPRVYLIPVGYDIMRSPTGASGDIRTWKILDQKLPVPFPIGAADLAAPNWIPMVDTLSEEYAAIRRYSSFRAYHDSGKFDPAETVSDSRLIGRSVWNTRWLLVIPAGTLHYDRQKALDTFVNGVTDIKVFFQTYAYSGN